MPHTLVAGYTCIAITKDAMVVAFTMDYLRRSGAFGFLLPLFGGADSSSVAVVVWYMCQLVVKEIANGDEQVKVDAIRIGNYRDGQYPTNSREFAKRIFYTIFMGSENR
ncbi:glutamine-dependent NAD(+) synthetase-like [Arachis hypogaea]|uniref:glutamine-dependent NAD(+) synthetase-like n=1 Tax=Arachis hypogaea TaxID=3818 RepID=UPI000DEC5226|nr:glutamine-dependent NAD(+) synthetase-like [Arachis hypogaea]QHO57777.1 Glutamine-dependent NAD(+) synthetase [Arachis hypogaea]